MKLKRRAAAFTLVEVMVALVIMAVMAAMAWRGIDGIVHARDENQQHLEQTVRLNTVIAQWEQDLASIQDSGVLDSALTCDGATVRMTRRTPTGLQIVAWQLRPDGNDSAWWRWASPPTTTTGGLQDSWMHSLQLQGNEAGQTRTIGGISQWQVYFFRGNAWSNCQSSADKQPIMPVQDSTNTNTNTNTGTGTGTGTSTGTVAAPRATTVLPTGVRLILTFDPGSGTSGTLTRDVVLTP